MIKAGILLWFYFIALIQLSGLSDPLISLFSFLFYYILYTGVRNKIIPKKIINYTALGAFSITFGVFWANIISFIFYFANLTDYANPLIMAINCIIYVVFFILFYSNTDQSNENDLKQHEPQNALQFIINITVPIVISVGIFLGTMYFNSLLTQKADGAIELGINGINIILNSLIISGVFTILISNLFENWIKNTSKKTIQMVFIIETIIGILLTILIAWTKII